MFTFKGLFRGDVDQEPVEAGRGWGVYIKEHDGVAAALLPGKPDGKGKYKNTHTQRKKYVSATCAGIKIALIT